MGKKRRNKAKKSKDFRELLRENERCFGTGYFEDHDDDDDVDGRKTRPDTWP